MEHDDVHVLVGLAARHSVAQLLALVVVHFSSSGFHGSSLQGLSGSFASHQSGSGTLAQPKRQGKSQNRPTQRLPQSAVQVGLLEVDVQVTNEGVSLERVVGVGLVYGDGGG
jgi:hypothetical protein